MHLQPTYLNIIDVVAVPCCAEKFVSEPEDQDVLDHLLTKVVVNTEKLVLRPVGRECLLELAGALEVLSERLLNLRACY
jgi:hypothetical protein